MIVVGERPTIAGWIGIALIMAGLAVLMSTAWPGARITHKVDSQWLQHYR